MKQASEKIRALMQSEIRNMSIECDKVGGINLSQGVCDLPLTDVLKQGVYEALDAGYNHYTRYDGIEQLRRQLSMKTRHFNGFNADPSTEICVSAGATGALYCACYALFQPEDEIIMFEPYYGYHEHTFISLDLVPVYAKLSPPNWDYNLDELEHLVTPKTRAIMINTPSNPCGKVYSEKELNELADFAIRHNLIVLTDEIYEYITYDGRNHISPARLDKLRDRTVTISGYSKTFSITGWRIGYSIAPAQMNEWIGAANDLLYVCAPAPLQYAVAKAIAELDESFYEKMRQEYQHKRDMLCNMLNEVGLTPYVPQGAYYVLADVSCIPGKDSKERAMWLLEQTGIGVVPGEEFYKNADEGKKMVRFCFAKDADVIGRACEVLLDNKSKWR